MKNNNLKKILVISTITLVTILSSCNLFNTKSGYTTVNLNLSNNSRALIDEVGIYVLTVTGSGFSKITNSSTLGNFSIDVLSGSQRKFKLDIYNEDESLLLYSGESTVDLTNGVDVSLEISVTRAALKIEYFASDATGTVPTTTYHSEGASVTLASGSGLTLSGKVFAGWSTTASGAMLSNPYTMPADDVTLYAVWTDIPVTGVTITSTPPQVFNPGTTYQMSATVSPSDATDQTLTWTSSDPDIATVSATGLVTAVTSGTPIITVTTTDGSKTATQNLIIIAPTEYNPSNILIIYDDSPTNVNTLSLKSSLEDRGFTVTLSNVSESMWSNDKPSLVSFAGVIHMNGTTYTSEMPEAGQIALVDYVKSGGRYVGAEWNGYQISNGQMTAMQDLILLDRGDAIAGLTTYQKSSEVYHPVMVGIPSTFNITGDFNGTAHVFSEEPSVVLMTEGTRDAVVYRELGFGKVLGFHHTGNYSSFAHYSDPNIQLIVANFLGFVDQPQ